jgi:tRNA(Ile)-lysidine synthase
MKMEAQLHNLIDRTAFLRYKSGQVNILKKVFLTIDACDLIRPEETVLCAVSGGADSVAMLHILAELEKLQQQKWKLHVAHVNHGLRGKEADDDEKFVKKTAKELGLPFSSKSVDVLQVRTTDKLSVEEAARKLRHEALKKLAVDVGARKIALAHTLDDQSETIMHRIIRGAGLRGLRGMGPIRLVSKKHELFLIRPLLEMERTEVRTYLTERTLEWREDASNLDRTFMRNRLRHDLLPMIERDFNPRFKYALVKLGQTASAFYLLVREIAGEIYENVKLISKEGEVCLSAEEFGRVPIPVQTLILDRAFKTLSGRIPPLTFEHYMDIISLCGDQGHSKTIMLPRGVEARREGYVLKLYRPTPEPEPFRFNATSLKIPGRTILRKLGLTVDAEVMQGKVVGLLDYMQNKDQTEEILDFDRVKGALTVRQRKSGDTFHPLGSSGSMKLKKFMIDSKVPQNIREHIPIITDDSRIVWVLGYRIADEVKVTDATRQVLKLKFTRK